MTLFVINASGGMNPAFSIGDLMIINDHINFFPEHPLHGPNFPTGPRFPDMHEAYDHNLIALADEIAKEQGVKLQHGVYVGVQGPTFETPAEYHMYRILGGDAVGMSTVPEVIVHVFAASSVWHHHHHRPRRLRRTVQESIRRSRRLQGR
jgi:purine-nucleoside phosphorylase